MFPAGMLGSARRKKTYGIELKSSGGGGGGADGSVSGGLGSEGATLRFDITADQFSQLNYLSGDPGERGWSGPTNDPANSPPGRGGWGYRNGGDGGDVAPSGTSGKGGAGAGSSAVSLGDDLLAVAGGGAGGGGGSAGRSGGNGGQDATNPADSSGNGQKGATWPTGDGGGGGGGGGGVDAAHPGGNGGRAGIDNSQGSGGGQQGGSYLHPTKTSTYTGATHNLSAYGLGGSGGTNSGPGQNGSRGALIVTDYETGISQTYTSGGSVPLP